VLSKWSQVADSVLAGYLMLQRKQGWEYLHGILSDSRRNSCCPLYGKPGFDIPIIRRPILGYALSCPEKAAKDFVEQSRKRDPEMVKDAEELLKLETGKTS